jgi:hypothetical protein
MLENVDGVYSICVIGKYHHFHIALEGDCLVARFMRYFSESRVPQYIPSKLPTSPS